MPPRVIDRLVDDVRARYPEREIRECCRGINDRDSERESAATCGETRSATAAASALEINVMDTEIVAERLLSIAICVYERTTGSTRNRM